MHNSYFVKSFCWCIISKGSTSLSKYYFIAKIKQEKAIDLLMRKEVFLSKSEHMILLARSLFSHFFKEICIEVSYNKIMLIYILWTNSCFDGSLSLLNMKCLSASWDHIGMILTFLQKISLMPVQKHIIFNNQ